MMMDKENLENVKTLNQSKSIEKPNVSYDFDFEDVLNEGYDKAFTAMEVFDYVDFCIAEDDMPELFLDDGEILQDYLDEEIYEEDSGCEMEDSDYEENSEDLEVAVNEMGLVRCEDALSMVGRNMGLYEMVVDTVRRQEGEVLRTYENASMEIHRMEKDIVSCLRKFFMMASGTSQRLEVDDDSVAFFREFLSSFVTVIMGAAEAYAECSEMSEVDVSQVLGALEFFGLSLPLSKLSDEEAIFFQFDLESDTFRELAGAAMIAPASREAMDYLQIAFEEYLYQMISSTVQLQIVYGYEATVDISDILAVLQTWKSIPTPNNLVARMGY